MSTTDLTLSTCLDALSAWKKPFPVDELNWLRAHWSEAEPALLQLLADAIASPSENEDSAVSMYAMYLLAEQRSEAAFPLYLSLCRLAEAETDMLLGDIITQDMPSFLAATCAGRYDALKELVEDDSLFGFSRAAALGALRISVLIDLLSRDDLIKYLIHLFNGGLAREESPILDEAVCVACDLHPGDLLPLIKHAYAEGIVDEGMVSLNEVLQESRRSLASVMARSRHYERGLPGPVEQEITWMAPFSSSRPPRERNLPPYSPAYQDARDWATIKRDTPKTGRNESCPCGSGRKYKKCCGAS